MEKESEYLVQLTDDAEGYYLDLLNYLYSSHSPEKANIKSGEILNLAQSLKKYPERGSVESTLSLLGMNHRYLLYNLTPRKTIKIIYFISKSENSVFVTDFFPTEMDTSKIKNRNK